MLKISWSERSRLAVVMPATVNSIDPSTKRGSAYQIRSVFWVTVQPVGPSEPPTAVPLGCESLSESERLNDPDPACPPLPLPPPPVAAPPVAEAPPPPLGHP